MSKIVEVKLWGTTIGHLGYAGTQTEVATFEYTEAFAGSGIQVSPLMMRVPTRQHSFPDISQRTFKGLPGVFSDSLPDTFGNQLIDLFMAEKKVLPQDITALDRLLYVGSRGMGALEYHPDKMFVSDNDHGIALDVHTLAELAAMVVSRDQGKRDQLLDATNHAQAIRLIRVGSSAGGARSKALIAKSAEGIIKDGTVLYDSDHRYWLMKFDSEENKDRDHADPKGMTKIEYIYSQLAKDCSIDIPATDYIKDRDDFHFLIERFDRIPKEGKTDKVHYASWSGINHAHRDATGIYSYEQLLMTAKQLKLGQSAYTEIFKRAVFNVVGRNQDDHSKNFGFLMRRSGQWELAPAFDMTYAYDPQGKWTQGHQIRLGGKQTDFTRDDLVIFGQNCNLNTKKATQIIDHTLEVFSCFEAKAKEFDVDKDLLKSVVTNQRMNLR